MTWPPSADWSRWANVAFWWQPEGTDHLVAEPTPAEQPVEPVRYRRRVRMPDGREGITYDPPEAPKPTQITQDEDGHLVVRRPLG